MKRSLLLNKGFTLIELMIVIAIITIIAAILIPSMIKARSNKIKKDYPFMESSDATHLTISDDNQYIIEEWENNDVKVLTHIRTRLKYTQRDDGAIYLKPGQDEGLLQKEIEKEKKDQLRRDIEDWDNQKKTF